MKNNFIKIRKKDIISCIQNKQLKILVDKHFKHLKSFINGYFNLNKLLQENNKNELKIEYLVNKIEYYFNMDLNDETDKDSLNNLKDNEAIDFITDNYIRILALDYKILENKTNLDLIYEYNKLQIRLFLLSKNQIVIFFPTKLNMIIETFNNSRKPIYKYVEIN